MAVSRNGWFTKILIGGGLLFIVSVAFAAGGAYVTVQDHVNDLGIHPSIEQMRSVITQHQMAELQQSDSVFDLLREIQRSVLVNRQLICDHMTDMGQGDSACRELR